MHGETQFQNLSCHEVSPHKVQYVTVTTRATARRMDKIEMYAIQGVTTTDPSRFDCREIKLNVNYCNVCRINAGFRKRGVSKTKKKKKRKP